MPESHVSRFGIVEDDDGFCSVTCRCGETIGPAPDVETVLDMAMEHAHARGYVEATREATDG